MFINGQAGVLPMRVDVSKHPPSIHCLCALPGSARHQDQCPLCPEDTDRCTGPLCEVPIHVITDWSISDHMNSSKHNFTS
ncbi:unnamed protein product [Staurois parvus]|uniref:Uncharacterized protein n=1 Tax=Staurois parvus TaxID=386267 RepID=A0ABN9EQT4_9NEOB|nr:unnamed protein product [Staurois parvus]